MPPPAAEIAARTPWRATGREAPVFLDESGRRRRRMNLVALACACGATLWLTGILGGFLGFSGLPVASGPAAPQVRSADHANHHRHHAGHRISHRLGTERILASGPAEPLHRPRRS